MINILGPCSQGLIPFALIDQGYDPFLFALWPSDGLLIQVSGLLALVMVKGRARGTGVLSSVPIH